MAILRVIPIELFRGVRVSLQNPELMILER